MWIVLLGCHGAGKTTLGKALARYTGWTFHEELGRRLAEDRRWRAPGASASDSQQAFDDEVMNRELRRDLDWPAGKPRIIETWHPGNIAYARARGSQVAAALRWHLEQCCSRQPILVLPVEAPREVLAARQSEAGELDFFLGVEARSLDLVRELGLPVLTPARTDLDPPALLASRLGPSLLGQVRRRLSLSQGAFR